MRRGSKAFLLAKIVERRDLASKVPLLPQLHFEWETVKAVDAELPVLLTNYYAQFRGRFFLRVQEAHIVVDAVLRCTCCVQSFCALRVPEHELAYVVASSYKHVAKRSHVKSTNELLVLEYAH